LLLLPLSGWLMATTTPVRVPTHVFGIFALPYPLAPDTVTYRIAHAIHVAAAVLLATLILLHIAAAMFHAVSGRTPFSTSGDTVRKPM
jgi:cytochrome b561